MDYWQEALYGLPVATFLGVQVIMFRRLLNTYNKSEVEQRLSQLSQAVDDRFNKHDELLSKNTEALNEVTRSLAIVATKLDERTTSN